MADDDKEVKARLDDLQKVVLELKGTIDTAVENQNKMLQEFDVLSKQVDSVVKQYKDVKKKFLLVPKQMKRLMEMR